MLNAPYNQQEELTPQTLAIMEAFARYTGTAERDVLEQALYAAHPELSVLVQNHRKFYALANVDIAAGQLVAFVNFGGVLQAVLASSVDFRRATGYCRVAATAGSYGEFILWEGVIATAGLTPGATYYLGDAGALATTVGARTPQAVGIALSATVFYFKVMEQEEFASESEAIVIRVRNASGATINRGSAVYISGATGQTPTISLAKADVEVTSSRTLGILEQTLANNAEGHVIVIGQLGEVDTSAFADGDALWLSDTTAGALTNVKPATPSHLVFVGYCAYAHAVHGKIVVNVQNGYELEELHDVSITAPAAGDTLTYDAVTGTWKNTPIGGTLYSGQQTGFVAGSLTVGQYTDVGISLPLPVGTWDIEWWGGGSLVLSGGGTAAGCLALRTTAATSSGYSSRAMFCETSETTVQGSTCYGRLSSVVIAAPTTYYVGVGTNTISGAPTIASVLADGRFGAIGIKATRVG